MNIASTDRTQILNSINSLRGVSALMVCLYHFAYIFKDSQKALYDVLFWGQEGVYVFFVISAVVLPYAMEKASFHWSDSGNFLMKRLLRLHPPFILSAILFSISMNWWQSHVFYSWPLIKNFLFNITFLAPWVGEKWILDIFWFLPVQFQFYLAIALIFPLLSSKNEWVRRLVMLGFMALCFIRVIPGAHSKDAIFFHVPIFSMGLLLYWYMTRKVKILEFAIWMLMASYLAFTYTYPRIAMVSIGTVVALLILKSGSKYLNKLGDVSYSFYLTHFIPGSLLTYYCLPFATSILQKYLLLSSIVILSILFSMFFYWLIEKPSARWSKAVTYKKAEVSGK